MSVRFYSRLSKERLPLVLLLGEDGWSESTRGDAFLASVLEKLGRGGEAKQRWAVDAYR